MATEYCRQMLRIVVAQICQHLGWNSTNATPLEVLTDVLERYILDVSKLTHQYAERYGRTQVNLNDLGLAFRTLGISVSELEDYVKHVEAFAFEKDNVSFPKPKKSMLSFPNPKSREIYHREEHIAHYLPYMYPGMEDEVEVEEEVSPTPSVPAAAAAAAATQPGSTTPVSAPNSQEIRTPENLSETSPGLRAGEKRPLSSPSEGLLYKRQRLNNNNLPEEAGHSQYEITSVKMSQSGLLTPVKNQGKLPEASHPQIFIPVEKKKEPPPKEITKKSDAGITSNTSKLEDKENITIKKSNTNEKETGKKHIPVKTSVKMASKSGANCPANKSVKKVSVVKGKITKIAKKGTNRSVVAAKSVKGKVISKSTAKAISSNSTKAISKTASADTIPNQAPGKRLKELLLDSKAEKAKVAKIEKKPQIPSPSVKKSEEVPPKLSNNLLMPANTIAISKNIHPVQHDDSSTDESPEPRLVIAESDPKPKDKSDAKCVKSAKYDNIISSVVKRDETGSQEKGKSSTTPGLKEKKKTTARKKKEPVERSTSESIDACINTVVRNYRAAADRERKQKELDATPNKNDADAMAAAATAAVVSAAAAAAAASTTSSVSVAASPIPVKSETPSAPKKGDKKLEKKKKNLMKEKTKKLKIKALKQKGKENAEVREKLKEKIKSKTQRQNSSSSEKTPPARPDKFTAEEWKIYDFDGSPPGSHSYSPPAHMTSPLSISHSPKQTSPTSMDSLTLLSTAASSAANVTIGLSPSTPASMTQSMSIQHPDLTPQLKMKIGIEKGGKGKIKSKMKSKDKEHKKDKKDRKKDKEKKKKNKEKDEKKQKDKDRSKEDKYQCVVVPQADQVSTPLSVPRLKLNIKFGGSTPVAVTPNDINKKPIATAVSVSVTEHSPTSVIKRDTPATPPLVRPEIPRLVIRTPTVLSPPTPHSEKIEKPSKSITKTKPVIKKKAVVKKPIVKKGEKKSGKKCSKAAAISIGKMEGLVPVTLPSEVGELNKPVVGEKLVKPMLYVEEAISSGIKSEKSSAAKPVTKTDKLLTTTGLEKHEIEVKAKQATLKAENTFVKAETTPPKPTVKAGKTLGRGGKGAKATKAVAKTEKIPAKAKAEKSVAKTKTALKSEKVLLTKTEKQIITKEKSIMKINKPPNKLGRPPKVEIPPSPPPTIPFPSSPPHITPNVATLPIVQPITHPSFTPLLANIPTPIPSTPRPSPIPAPKIHTMTMPKVIPTPKPIPTPKLHTGRGAKTLAASKTSVPNTFPTSKNVGMSASTPVKKDPSDSIMVKSSNLLTPMPLLPSSLPPDQPWKMDKSSLNPNQLSSPIHVTGGIPLDNSSFILQRDTMAPTISMNPTASFSVENPAPLGKRTVQRSVFAETVGTFMDENGQKIWICPGCKLPDDGSPMIGCDGCDDWYHWPCVNIKEEPPTEEQWFCQKCLIKTKHKPKRKRRRKAKAY